MAGKTKYPGVYPYTKGGRTFYRCTWRDADGISRQARGFTSQLAAHNHRKEQVGYADAGIVTTAAAPAQTFAELYAEFLAARRPYLAPGTYEGYEVAGRLRLTKHIVGKAAKITDRDVRAFMSAMAELVEDEEIKPKTVNNSLIALVACFSWAVETKRLRVNPALGIQRLPVEDVEPDYLRLAEIAPYLDGCSDLYRPLAELLIATGMRISEALGLRWDDVDWDGGTIRVYRQRISANATGPTKSRKFRKVEVGPDLLDTLRSLRARQSEFVEGDLARTPVFIMPTRVAKADGGRWSGRGDLASMDRNTVSRDWHHDTLENAGLRSMPLHSLRHTAAASWLTAGQPLIYVQRQLGHSSIMTTESKYGHLESGSGAAAAVEAFINSATR
jgi:integrase